MKKFYRRVPGFGDKYLVNSIGDLYNLKLKKEIKEQVTKNGKSFYIIKHNGQSYKFSRTGLRNMAFAYGSYKDQEKGEIVYIDTEENKVC